MYKNYVFDLYGTLVDINTNEWKSYLWKKMQEFYAFYGADYEWKELKNKYEYICKTEEEKMKNCDYPEIKVEYVFQKLFLDKGIQVSIETVEATARFFRIISTNYIRLYDGVEGFLQLLKSKNKKVYLLSNAQKVFTDNEFRMLKLDRYFDGMVYSSEEGCKKPSVHFFDVVTERYHLKKSETIMIGNDWISDIQGAAHAGMDSLYIHTNISPKDTDLAKVKAKYIISDGDFNKISKLILR
ncbi:MAG: HAD family hydrolase [Lachnospiraceae bacterium]|nr:HAD family hydrolase [Lachnospiraceae bacterium]